MEAFPRLALLALKHARTSEDLEARLLRWIELVAAVLRAEGGAAALALVQRYVLEVSAHVQEEFFEGTLAQTLPAELKESIVTTGQQLIERGRQQGLKEGLREGLKEGRAEQLGRQLAHRFGELSAAIRDRIAAATTEQLDAWAIRLLDARTLAEVFGDASPQG